MVVVLRSILFWIGYILSIIVICTLLTLLFFLPRAWKFKLAEYLSRMILGWLAITCNLGYEVEGKENLPNTAFIAMGNHQSTWETASCQIFFNPATWVVKRELLWIPIFGWGLWSIRPVALNRSAGRKAIDHLLKQGEERLENGISIIVFPEGTRVNSDERPPFKVGASLLAARTKALVVPFAHNAGKFWPKGSFLKHPGKIKLIIGEPIKTAGLKAEQINHIVETWVRTTQDELDQQS
ncbi:Acyl-CoA:1-acyl-sn-glycerol-3-phosphate acyltransferase [hydrothermal vent metagenome]|uniref:Acyl-CoA:1-acyl-sn-glycerol-3-phosphate acyltransferase n=1 Tax=hydrothermal vent metagenome TaxID=652676 RepID=A0A3B0ZF54_9ZZZZ